MGNKKEMWEKRRIKESVTSSVPVGKTDREGKKHVSFLTKEGNFPKTIYLFMFVVRLFQKGKKKKKKVQQVNIKLTLKVRVKTSFD